MSTRSQTIVVTTCDRPKCGTVISEVSSDDIPEEVDPKEPDLVIKRVGKSDIVYPDLCGRCTETTDNYFDRIEKKPAPKKKGPAAPAEPADPGALRWDDDSGEWAMGEGDDRRAYSHKPGEDLTTIIPALEGVTDPAEAGALIAAYEEAPPTGGEESDR